MPGVLTKLQACFTYGIDVPRPRNKPQPTKPTEGIDGLDAKKVAALSLLAFGESPPRVAKTVGVNRTTVWRWTQEPEFAAVLAELHRDLTEIAKKRLRALAQSAVDTLDDLLESDDTRAALGAANSILDRIGVRGEQTDSSVADRVVKALSGKGSFERAQRLTQDALRGEQ